MAQESDGSVEPMLTKSETAKWLSVSPWTLQRMVDDGRLTAVRLRAHSLRFRRSDVERCLREQQVAARDFAEADDQVLDALLDTVAELIASAWRAKQAAP